jgi:hypothetical protein
MRLELILRFDYGLTIPWVTRLPDGSLNAIAGPSRVVLRTPVELQGKDLTTVAEFDVAAGDVIPFVLTHGDSHRDPPKPIDPNAALTETEAFWSEWASRNKSTGEWGDCVMRSLITLKALTFAPTGGIVAAPTTSLPEQLGGPRNWDYRFCWLRDATLTLLALMNAGYYDEAGAWRDWLLRAAAGAPAQLQIMYGLAVNGGSWNSTCRGCPATKSRYRFGLAMRHTGSCSWTCTAKSWTPCIRRAAVDSRRAKRIGRFSGRCCSTSRRSGISRTRGSGKCAAGAVTLPIQR